MTVARALRAAGVVGLFDEADGGGDWRDIDAPRNAPLKSPHLHMDKVHYHSLLNYLEVAFDTLVTVNHGSIAGIGAPPAADLSAVFGWGGVSDDHLLLTHGLGVIPPFFRVAVGSVMINSGHPTQIDTGGRVRYVSAYATTTEIRLWETASRTSATLASASIDYRVLVCRPPPAPASDALIEVIGGVTMFSGRRWRSDRRYLQVVAGGTPFALLQGRGGDIHNGALRIALASGSTLDPVPATTVRILPGTGAYGPSLAYGGSFAVPDIIAVQAP